MKRQATWTTAMLLLAAAAAGGKETPTERCLLVLDLRDGSSLRGSTGLASIPLATAYGKLDLPTRLIRTVTFTRKSARGETWTVAAADLSNGDRLHGRMTLGTLELDTPYGKNSVPAVQILRLTVLPDLPAGGPVAFWSGDGHAKDGVGANHGTVGKGVCYTADRHGSAKSAFLFNGRSGFVTVPDSDALDTDEAFTLSAWVKPEAYGDETGRWSGILCKWWYQGCGGDYMLFLHTTGLPSFYVAQDTVKKQEAQVNAKSTAPKGKWTHVAATFERGAIKLYVNGKLEGSAVSTKVTCTSPAEYSHDDITIGALWDDHYNFHGAIDEVGIWNRALSAEEIAQLAGGLASRSVRAPHGKSRQRGPGAILSTPRHTSSRRTTKRAVPPVASLDIPGRTHTEDTTARP